MGAKPPAGIDVDTLWATVSAGRGTAGTIERWDASALPVQFACEVKDFDATSYFGPKEVRRQDRVTQLGFAAAADALADPGDVGADPTRSPAIAATALAALQP